MNKNKNETYIDISEKILHILTSMPEPDDQFVESLRTDLSVGKEQQIVSTQNFSSNNKRWIKAILLPILLVLFIVLSTFIIYSPEKVFATVRQLFAYDEYLGDLTEVELILLHPIIVTNNEESFSINVNRENDYKPTPLSDTAISETEFVITITDVAVNATETIVVYQMNNLPLGLQSFVESEEFSMANFGQIKLPSEVILQPRDKSVVSGTCTVDSCSIFARLLFEKLPADISEFVFTIMLNFDHFPIIGEDIVIPIELTPIDQSIIVDDIKEINCSGSSKNNIFLEMIDAKPMEDGTAFTVLVNWAYESVIPSEVGKFQLSDGEQNNYEIGGYSPMGSTLVIDDDSKQPIGMPITLRTTINHYPDNLILSLDWIDMAFIGNELLTVDFSNVDNNNTQEIIIDKTMNFRGYEIVIKSAALKKDENGDSIIEFILSMPPESVGLMLGYQDPVLIGEYHASFTQDENGNSIYEITAPENIDEPISFNISQIWIKINGPWEVPFSFTDNQE